MIEGASGLATPSLFGAALHCQQAAEKLAKAALIAFGTRPPRTYDVLRLAQMVQAVHSELGAEVESVAQVTTWYAASRYPDVPIDSLPSWQDIRWAQSRLQALHARLLALAPRAK
jgi:HEPN domain-containing protein